MHPIDVSESLRSTTQLSWSSLQLLSSNPSPNNSSPPPCIPRIMVSENYYFILAYTQLPVVMPDLTASGLVDRSVDKKQQQQKTSGAVMASAVIADSADACFGKNNNLLNRNLSHLVASPWSVQGRTVTDGVDRVISLVFYRGSIGTMQARLFFVFLSSLTPLWKQYISVAPKTGWWSTGYDHRPKRNSLF